MSAKENAINSKTLLTTIAEAAAEKKAENIVLLDVRGLTSYTDYLVLATGNSSRQVSAIGEHVEKKIQEARGPQLAGREGYEQGLWVLIDFSEVIVHIFEPAQRDIFDLEHLWAEAPRLQWNPLEPPRELFPSTAAVAAPVAAPARARRAR
jgi:ribosome-associated protein